MCVCVRKNKFKFLFYFFFKFKLFNKNKQKKFFPIPNMVNFDKLFIFFCWVLTFSNKQNIKNWHIYKTKKKVKNSRNKINISSFNFLNSKIMQKSYLLTYALYWFLIRKKLFFNFFFKEILIFRKSNLSLKKCRRREKKNYFNFCIWRRKIYIFFVLCS